MGGVTSASPESASDSSQVDSEQAAYLSNVLVNKVSVGKGSLGEPVFGGEIKNSGDRTLKKVEITIIALGRTVSRCSTKTYLPVLVSRMNFADSNQPLKAGYSRQFGVKRDDRAFGVGKKS